MMSVGLLAATLLSATTALAPAHKSLDFIGFSHNEKVHAWRQSVAQPQPHGLVDHYTLIRLIETDSERLLAVYRDNGVRRTDAHGNFVFTTQTTQLRDNPAWAQAQSHRDWQHVARGGHFYAGRLDFKGTVVRLSTDDDASVQDIKAEHKTMVVDASIGSPIGYVPMARLLDGQLLPLGHFRFEAETPGSHVHAAVEVFYSHSGRSIAVLNKFHSDGHAEQAQVSVVSTPHDPIAEVGVGTLRMIEDDAETSRRLFVEMHPEGRKIWDEDMGSTY